MSVEIISTDERTLYVAVSASDVRAAVAEAVRAGANLTDANLPGADLADADLAGAYLSGANLASAYLIGSNLSGIYLIGANLTGANLSGANLAGAYLADANLSGTNLEYASLIGANLEYANLIGADLIGANLTGARGTYPDRFDALRMLREQPGPICAYKLVDNEFRSSTYMDRELTYAPGVTLEVVNADEDESKYCGEGINVATLPWCLQNWRDGYHVMVVEFTATDIVAIPFNTDGKFRVRRCRVVREKKLDLVALGLVREE